MKEQAKKIRRTIAADGVEALKMMKILVELELDFDYEAGDTMSGSLITVYLYDEENEKRYCEEFGKLATK